MLLTILFLLFTIILLLYTFLISKKNKKIDLLTFINLFFILIYFIVPLIIIFYHEKLSSTSPVQNIDFTNPFFQDTLFNSLFYSVVSFISINFGMNIKVKFKKQNFYFSENTIVVSAWILTLLGLISLLIWSSAYGGPFSALKYANSIRAGRDIGINNRYSFFMKMIPFGQIGFYFFFSLLFTRKTFSNLLGFLISAIVTILYILANSSRMHMVLLFVILFLIYKLNTKIKKRDYIFFGIGSISALLIMSSAESILNVLQGTNASIQIKFNIFKVLAEEFFFPLTSLQVYLKNSPPIRLHFDLVSAILAWFPSSFRPDSLIKLEVFNTLLWKKTLLFGGLPTDIVTTSLYELHFLGPIVLPFMYGIIARNFNDRYSNIKEYHSSYQIVVKLLGSFYILKAIPYNSYDNIMTNIFNLVFSILTIKLISFFERNQL